MERSCGAPFNVPFTCRRKRQSYSWRVAMCCVLLTAPAFVGQCDWRDRSADSVQPRRRKHQSVQVPMLATSGAEQETTLADHNGYQEATFDRLADFFASPEATPPDMVPRLQRIAEACELDASTSILDVATGTGALLPFYAEKGASLSKLVGVDLSVGMLNHARAKFPEATFVQADINDYIAPDGLRFDRVVFNAVFGNLFDQAATLRHVSSLTSDGGLVVISHPMGRRWLREVLHASDPRMVPHDIPGEAELRQLITSEGLDFRIVAVDDEADYYCAVLQRGA